MPIQQLATSKTQGIIKCSNKKIRRNNKVDFFYLNFYCYNCNIKLYNLKNTEKNFLKQMKKNIYLLILSFGMLLFITTAFAQQRSVTGTVTDVANGSPLPNVSISVKGTNIRTQSDEQGKFSIMAEVNQVLVFNLVGYNTLEQNSGSSNFVNVQMSQSTQQIGEVIITAMGIQKDKKALGYAAQDIKSSEILKNKNPNIINSLNGKIAGVNITNAGG